MDTLTTTPYRLMSSRTPDGVIVLRYHEEWPSEHDHAEFLAPWAGAPPHEPGSDTLRLLVDLRGVADRTSGTALLRFVRGMPDLVRRLPQRRAYLVSDPAQQGLAKLIQVHAGPHRIEAGYFTTWNGALDWLRERG
jgi:hypothetical protein